MKFLFFTAIALSILPLAQANEFSIPRTDWMQPQRMSRLQKSQARYHRPRAVQPSKVIFNFDGSITFKEPKLVRGPRFLSLSSDYSEKDGICKLFGMDVFLEESLETKYLPNVNLAVINAEGRFSSSDEYETAVSSISCTYRNEYFQTGIFDRVSENPDGSVTISQPQIIRADKSIALSSDYSEKEGVCRLFGFDSYLEESVKTRYLPNKNLAVINANGAFGSSDEYETAIDSISCFMKGDYQQTGFARRMKRNLDDSVTISKPLIIRGAEAKPISSDYSEKRGVCRLFGFGNYLEESLTTRYQPNVQLATINANGMFGSSDEYDTAVDTVTCYNGRYRTTALAGGFLFQNGEWLGKIKRSQSRWGNSDGVLSPSPVEPKPAVGPNNPVAPMPGNPFR